MSDKNKFLYPQYPYHGDVKPENLVFNANLQEFSQRVIYTCALATNGKLSEQQAYRQIKSSWKELKRSRKQLKVGKNIFSQEQ